MAVRMGPSRLSSTRVNGCSRRSSPLCAIERDLLRSTQAARRLVCASGVLAGEAKRQALGRCREGTERHLEASRAGHDAPDGHEGLRALE